MAFTAKVLASGQVPDLANGALYAVPALTRAYVKKFTLFNTNAATQIVLLYINSAGTPRQWKRYELAQHESADPLMGDSLQLEAGDAIEAVTTTAAAVDYHITGVEEA